MSGIRIKNRDILVNRFGLDERVAGRVAELLAEKIDMTEAVLKAVATDRALENAVLDRDLTSGASPMDEARLQEAARRYGYKGSRALKLAAGPGGWRTISFQADITVGGEESAPGPGEDGGPASLLQQKRMSDSEIREFFSAHDIANLKMEALTGQDPRQRIEAVRRLVYVPESGTGKAGIFVSVLNDKTAGSELRREALKALENIGLDSELADSLMLLFDESEEVAASSLPGLKSLLEGADDAQAGVALAVLLEVLERTDSAWVCAELMLLIAGKSHILARSRGRFAHFIRLAVRRLDWDFTRLHKPVGNLVRLCHDADPLTVQDLLWKEYERTASPMVKGFLTRRIADICKDPERIQRLAYDAIEEIMSAQLSEEERSYLRHAIVRTGEPAVRAAAEKLGHTSDQVRSEVVSLLDFLCRECKVSDEIFLKAVRAMLRLLKVGRRNTRRRVLEAAIFADPRIPASLKSEIASELLAHISEFQMVNTRDDICHSLQQLGAAAIAPLLNHIRLHFPAGETDALFLTLGRIAEEEGEGLDDEAALGSIDLCMELLQREDNQSGKFCIALAWFCGRTRQGAGFVDGVIDILLDRTWKSKYTFDIIRSLGILAGSENITGLHRRKIFDMFSHIATLRTDASIGVERAGEEGPVYEFGKGIYFETTVIPAVINGLQRLGENCQAEDELCVEVVKRLLVLWEGVSNMRLVWCPAAVESLVNAIGAVASSSHIGCDMRFRLGRALLDHTNKTSVVMNMGRICSGCGGSEKMTELSLNAGNKLLGEWANAQNEELERRAAILQSLGSIAANNALDPQDKGVKRMRETVINALFQGLREGVFQVKEPLELLRDCNGLTGQQCAEIQTRLQQAYGLERVE